MKISKIETVDINASGEFCDECDFLLLGICRFFNTCPLIKDGKYLRLDKCITGEELTVKLQCLGPIKTGLMKSV